MFFRQNPSELRMRQQAKHIAIYITWISVGFLVFRVCVDLLLQRMGFRIWNPYSAENEDSLLWLDEHIEIMDPRDVRLDQYNPMLYNYIRARYLYPPPSRPYDFESVLPRVPNIDKKLLQIVVNKLEESGAYDGVFVEAGAFDGLDSHTLELEMHYNWTGLLAECNPKLIPFIRRLARKAFFASLCLSRTPFFVEDTLTSMDNWLGASSFGMGDIFPHNVESNYTRFVVQMAPLYSIIAAAGFAQIDYLVLDVQSLEWEVIRHFPFHKILVKIWVVETYFFDKKMKIKLRDFMASQNYVQEEYGMNDIFTHRSIL